MSNRIDTSNVMQRLTGGIIDMGHDSSLLGVTKNRNELMG